MRALSLRPEWAMPVLLGQKTVECRTWRTSYRGELLICASSRPLRAGAIAGYALCKVLLVGVRPFEEADLAAALLEDAPEGAYAWELADLRLIEPFPVKGKLGLFEVPDSSIKEIPSDMSRLRALRTYYEPLLQ